MALHGGRITADEGGIPLNVQHALVIVANDEHLAMIPPKKH